MDTHEKNYKELITSFIQKHMIILGPNIALDTARAVSGLKIKDDGSVMEIMGDSQMVLKSLVNRFSGLSPEVAKMVLESITQKNLKM